MVTNKYRITRSAGELPALCWVRLAFAFLILSFILALPTGRVSAQPLRPGEVELEGTVEVLHEDRDVGSRYVYFLRTATERLELQFASDPPALATGDRIRARGLRTNGVLALTSSSSTQTLSTVLPHSFGEVKTLVILVNFADKATQPYTVSDAQGVLATTSNHYLENSFGQSWLTAVVDSGQAADVRGWYTIGLSSTVCDYSTLSSQAKSAAQANGVDLSAYNRFVYAFPNNACTWWGLGTVGGWPSSSSGSTEVSS